MLLIDALTRYSAVTLLVLVAILALRDGKRFAPARYAVLVCISVAAMLLSTAPDALRLPQIPFVVAHLLDTSNIVFIWWLCLSMFQDDFKLKLWHWATFALYTGLVLIYHLVEFDMAAPMPLWFDIFVDVVTLAMMVHLVYVVFIGRADDLIEPRRRLRVFFILALALGTTLTVLAESLFIKDFGPQVTLFRAATALPLTLWAVLWLTSFHPEKLVFQHASPIAAKPTSLDPRDTALHTHLLKSMDEDKIYLEPNLNIRTLAQSLKTPEHRLRALINQGMGYRNFSTFLNTYRIKEVKSTFADPNMSRIPVLTIAMDAGYNSLAPFNRAFLKAEGMTPSAYRQNILAKPPHK